MSNKDKIIRISCILSVLSIIFTFYLLINYDNINDKNSNKLIGEISDKYNDCQVKKIPTKDFICWIIKTKEGHIVSVYPNGTGNLVAEQIFE